MRYDLEWISESQAKAHVDGLARPIEFQTVLLSCDREQLARQIPMQPRVISPSAGPPTEMYQWYGRIKARGFCLEVSTLGCVGNSADMSTHFRPRQDVEGDWTVLLDLAALPKAIQPTRPIAIESREAAPDFVVYRPDPRGWNDIVYAGRSRGDAEGLLLFLKQDPWNSKCFIDAPEPVGEWTVFDNGRKAGGWGKRAQPALLYSVMSRRLCESPAFDERCEVGGELAKGPGAVAEATFHRGR